MIRRTIVAMQATIKAFNTGTVKHKSCPVTNETQSVGLSVSYFKLTIVLIIPKTKTGIPRTESPIRVRNIIFFVRFILSCLSVL